MMPDGQVLCGQAIFRQVRMAALQIESQSIGQTLQINARFGRLLLEERLTAGRSVRSIASKVKINRELLRKWEAGKASPPARTFIAVMRIYGREALFRAAELDFQIQIEKYELISKKVESKNKNRQLSQTDEQQLAA